MLIDILVKSRKGGYLAKESPGALSFFSNNTLCLRRSMLDELGRYDESCERSEDVEICARVARSRWMMFLSTDMVFYHRPRPSVVELVKQWWSYGKYIPYVFHKHNRGQWEIFYLRPTTLPGSHAPGLQYRKLLYLEQMPGTICVFITPFLLAQVFFLLFVASLAAGLPWLSVVLAVVSVFAFVGYAREDFLTRLPFLDSVKLFAVRYLVNAAFVLSHLLYGIPRGTLYIAPSIGTSSSPTKRQ